MAHKYEEYKQLYKEWNKIWKYNQEIRHEEWDARRSYADRACTTFEENLRRRIVWERKKKMREWRQYSLTIEKRLIENMNTKEMDTFY